MLGLIENQVMHMEPIPADDFAVELIRPNIDGIGRVVVKVAGQTLQRGVQFFVMGPRDHCAVDPVTGQFSLKPGRSATIRVIFAGQHVDVDIQ